MMSLAAISVTMVLSLAGSLPSQVEDPLYSPSQLERISNPRFDALPMMVRTRSIATMRRASTISQAEIIRFVPDDN